MGYRTMKKTIGIILVSILLAPICFGVIVVTIYSIYLLGNLLLPSVGQYVPTFFLGLLGVLAGLATLCGIGAGIASLLEEKK